MKNLKEDQEIFRAVEEEANRQALHIELIASENFVSQAVLEAQGSILTNKYAEGYSRKRYYGGCEFIDKVEDIAIARACQLFHAKYANVQPHSGSQANMGAYGALLSIGDTILGMSLDAGGHLTHGYDKSFSGKLYKSYSYGLNEQGYIDYDEVEALAKKVHPKLIVAGASAYSRRIDFKRFREIADTVGAYLMVDMAHIAGLVAAGLHPNPMDFADIVTSTTHKTLRGPRGGIILTNNEAIAKKINSYVFPGIQGGPLMHVIAAKAQCFYEALQPDFKEYAKQIIKNTAVLADTLKDKGFKLVSGGTDNHLILVNVKESIGITGQEAENILDEIYITVNKNTVPNETESPQKTSGIRVGAAAMTTRGLKEAEFKKIGEIIAEALRNKDDHDVLEKLGKEVLELTDNFPIYK